MITMYKKGVLQWLSSQAASFYGEGIQKLAFRYYKCLKNGGNYVEKYKQYVVQYSMVIGFFIFATGDCNSDLPMTVTILVNSSQLLSYYVVHRIHLALYTLLDLSCNPSLMTTVISLILLLIS